MAVGEQKDAQHQRAALEAFVVPDGRVRQRQELLYDVRVGVVPSRSAHSRRALASRPEPKTGSIDASANAGLIMPSARRRRASSSAAFSPHHQVAIVGISSFSPNSRSQIGGRNASSAGDSSTLMPKALASRMVEEMMMPLLAWLSYVLLPGRADKPTLTAAAHLAEPFELSPAVKPSTAHGDSDGHVLPGYKFPTCRS